MIVALLAALTFAVSVENPEGFLDFGFVSGFLRLDAHQFDEFVDVDETRSIPINQLDSFL